jgi:hypothetical protein
METSDVRLGAFLYSGELPCSACRSFRDSGHMSRTCETCGEVRVFAYVPHNRPDANYLRGMMWLCVLCTHKQADPTLNFPLCDACQVRKESLVVAPCPCPRCISLLC